MQVMINLCHALTDFVVDETRNYESNFQYVDGRVLL